MLSGLTFIARGRKILRSVVVCVCGVGSGVGGREGAQTGMSVLPKQRNSTGVILNGLEF